MKRISIVKTPTEFEIELFNSDAKADPNDDRNFSVKTFGDVVKEMEKWFGLNEKDKTPKSPDEIKIDDPQLLAMLSQLNGYNVMIGDIASAYGELHTNFYQLLNEKYPNIRGRLREGIWRVDLVDKVLRKQKVETNP